MKKAGVMILILVLTTTAAFSQWEDEEEKSNVQCVFKKDPFSIGLGIAFNPFIAQAGHDVRVTVPLSEYLNVSSEFYQYGIRDHDTANFYRFKEYYVNLGLNVKVYQIKRLNFYVNAAYLFMQWTNEDDITGACNYHGMQMGVGVDYSFKYFSIFLENTTNTVWWELNTLAGIKINKMPRIFSKPKNRYGHLLTEGI